jgi:ribonuclease HII
MRAFAKKYPAYSFEIHKGYGTRAHYAAIRKHGLCPIHRRSFLRKISAKLV